MSDRDPWFKQIPHFWPIAITLVGMTVSAASAGTRLNDLTDKVDYIYANGSPVVADRLAHIDEKQTQMTKQLDRMEDKLDADIDKEHDHGDRR